MTLPRRVLLSLVLLVWLASCAQTAQQPLVTQPAVQPAQVQQWDVYEITLHATPHGNPFDTKFSAKFMLDKDVAEVAGFYDGGDTYRVRFMPPRQGTWRF